MGFSKGGEGGVRFGNGRGRKGGPARPPRRTQTNISLGAIPDGKEKGLRRGAVRPVWGTIFGGCTLRDLRTTHPHANWLAQRRCHVSGECSVVSLQVSGPFSSSVHL
ncbi:hypothetical protein CEXT_240181 [Caerostris extrusa]|uniref:Uncharacterized protein n=1 Tax=Caerostris extrusa TaxID=172846 RepID=A0AAV4PXY5_CAEEX|nr:hypothetical protein CEXT_240181 [Caerostris extrusa]